MTGENLFAKAIANRKKSPLLEEVEPVEELEALTPSKAVKPELEIAVPIQEAPAPKKATSSKRAATTTTPTPQQGRGRPATGKRSNEDWIGRTYYIQRETDLDIEDELLKLRRQGHEVDKSELVDLLLSAWVKWRQGENMESQISEITPRQKSKKAN